MSVRVLIADDSETILLLLRTRLEMEGYEVLTATDGVEAIEQVRGAEPGPDILLLDAMMPRKSGIDAVRELRAAGLETPVLIVSAHTGEGDGNGDRDDLRIDGYLTKPIDFDDLFARIRELTGL